MVLSMQEVKLCPPSDMLLLVQSTPPIFCVTPDIQLSVLPWTPQNWFRFISMFMFNHWNHENSTSRVSVVHPWLYKAESRQLDLICCWWFLCVCLCFFASVCFLISSAPILLSDLSYFECLWLLSEHIFWQFHFAERSNHVNEIRVQPFMPRLSLTHTPRDTNMCRGILQETGKTATPHPPTSSSITQLPPIGAGDAIPHFWWCPCTGSCIVTLSAAAGWDVWRPGMRTGRFLVLSLFLFLHLSLIIWSFQSNTSLSLLKTFPAPHVFLFFFLFFIPGSSYLPPSLNFFIFCRPPLLSFSFHPSLSPLLSFCIPPSSPRPSCRCMWPFRHKLVCVIPLFAEHVTCFFTMLL